MQVSKVKIKESGVEAVINFTDFNEDLHEMITEDFKVVKPKKVLSVEDFTPEMKQSILDAQKEFDVVSEELEVMTAERDGLITERDALQARVTELEAGSTTDFMGGGTVLSKDLHHTQVPAHLATLTTVDDVTACVVGDERESVAKAAEARIAELSA